MKKNIITDYLPIWGAILAAIIAMFIGQVIPSFWLRIFTGLFMWIGLAISWNIVGGYTGYVNFGHGAFFGIGAYVAGVIILGGHMPFSIAMVVAAFIAAVVGLIIGYPTLRLRGAYFAIATWAFLEGTRQLALVLDITGGAYGMTLPPLLDEDYFFRYMLFLSLISFIGTYLLLEKSVFGYQLKAIRENELAARSLGINASLTRTLAFSLSCFIVALFGGVYGYWLTYIHPDNILSPLITDQMIVMTLLGGMGTIFGPVVGAVVLYTFNRLLWIYFTEGVYYYMLLGALICFTVVFLPDGIVGFLSRVFKKPDLPDDKILNIRGNLARWRDKLKI